MSKPTNSPAPIASSQDFNLEKSDSSDANLPQETPGLPVKLSGRRSFAVAALMTFSIFQWMASTLGTSVALPTICRDLNVTPAAAQWVVSANALTCGCCMLVAGRVADVYGKRNVFLIGLCCFFSGQLISGFMPSVTGLAVAQGLSGIGGSLFIPSGLGIIGASLPGGKPQVYTFAAFSAGGPVGGGSGALISGAIISSGLKWNKFYHVMAGVAVVPVVTGAYFLPRDEVKDFTQRVDWFSAAVVSAGLFLIIFAFSTSQTSAAGWSTRYIGPCVAIGALLLISFVVYQVRLRKGTPSQRASVMLPQQLLSRGNRVLMLLYVAGFWLEFASTVLVGFLQSRVSARILLCCGTLLTMTGLILMATAKPDWGYWRVQWLGMGLAVVAIDTAIAIGAAIIGDIVDYDSQSAAQALFATFMRVGSAMGLPVSMIIMNSFEQRSLRSVQAASNDTSSSKSAVLKGLQAGFWTSAVVMAAVFLLFLCGLHLTGVAGRHSKVKDDPSQAEIAATQKPITS